MEMMDILRMASKLKNLENIKDNGEDYIFYEGRSFQCGDYIRLQKRREAEEPLSFSGQCCKCCLVAADYVLEKYNVEKRIIDISEMKQFFGENMISARKDCFELPILLMKKTIGEKSNETERD